MTDPPASRRAWRGIDTPSTEQLSVERAEDGWIVRSRVASGDRSLEYTVEIDAGWVFRALRVERDDGLMLDLARSADGGWSADGIERDDLRDAIEIDLAFSPFTNTLPIRRLGLPIGGAAEIVTAYVDADLVVAADPQRYTRVSSEVYRYESLDADFVRDIAVDGQGFVLEYPGLFVALDAVVPD